MRLFRIVYCNVNVRIGKQFQAGTSSIVIYDQSSDLIKIEMVLGTSMAPKPGQHFFLYQGGVLKFWENHPFSLGAWTTASGGKTEGSPSGTTHNKLIFYVRPYDGWTRRLRDQASNANGIFRPKLLLEGPYGHTEPLHHFDTNLMIVGGTGIAAAIPYLLSHLERSKAGQTRTCRIHLVWVIREQTMWSHVFTDDLEHVLQSSDITITVYCTKPAPLIQDSGSQNERSDVAMTPKEKLPVTTATPLNSPTRSGLHLLPGRPSVRQLLMVEVGECKASSSSLGVFTCGPAQMADECRSSVYDAMKHGFHSIDYFEEAFGW